MTSPQPAEQRAALQTVTAAAAADLAEAWPGLVAPDADAVRDALGVLIPALVDTYGAQAGALGQDIYALLREDAGLGNDFLARPVPGAQPRTIGKTVGWAVEPLYSAEPNRTLALYRIDGGLQKLVADEYRDTIQTAAIEDPAAAGWQRQARPTGCPFCVMLAGRGAVYSEAGADFGSHPNCSCLAVPAFNGQPKPVKAYTPTNRTITEADRARVRRWIADHH